MWRLYLSNKLLQVLIYDHTSLFSQSFNIISDVDYAFEEKRGPQPWHKHDLGYNLHTQVINIMAKQKQQKYKNDRFKESDHSRINPFPKFDW